MHICRVSKLMSTTLLPLLFIPSLLLSNSSTPYYLHTCFFIKPFPVLYFLRKLICLFISFQEKGREFHLTWIGVVQEHFCFVHRVLVSPPPPVCCCCHNPLLFFFVSSFCFFLIKGYLIILLFKLPVSFPSSFITAYILGFMR